MAGDQPLRERQFLLAGSVERISQAWRERVTLTGGSRSSAVIAAAFAGRAHGGLQLSSLIAIEPLLGTSGLNVTGSRLAVGQAFLAA